jgi:hypothetical protein
MGMCHSKVGVIRLYLFHMFEVGKCGEQSLPINNTVHNRAVSYESSCGSIVNHHLHLPTPESLEDSHATRAGM